MIACSIDDDILVTASIDHNCHVCPLCLKHTVVYVRHENDNIQLMA